MSGVTNISNTNFTDISSKATERLLQTNPLITNQTKSVSKSKRNRSSC